MSTHTADVVKIKEVLPHNNADSLELINVFDYQCVVKKGEFKPGDLGVFFHPETMLDVKRPEFAFLESKANSDGRARLRIVRLRKEKSYGLLIKAPAGAKAGDNMWDHYGCQWYEPKTGATTKLVTGLSCKGPNFKASVPDPENIRKYKNSLDGHDVIYTTKLHGSFFRATYQDGEFFVGSKNQWRYKPGTKVETAKHKSLSWFGKLWNKFTKKINSHVVAPDNSWWKGFEQNPWIEQWLIQNEGCTLMGELVGPSVQKGFHYGFEQGKFGVYIFAVSAHDGTFLSSHDLHNAGRFKSLQKVPVLYQGKHDYDLMKKLGEQVEDLNDCQHIREGVVATKAVDDGVRIVLKYVSDNYLEKT